jgi:hypothetical protein
MGYVHYWRRHAVLDPTAFGLVARDVRRLVAVLIAAGLVLCGPLGRGRPLVTRSRLAFNGQEQCAHEERSLGIPWPADDAQGIAVGHTVGRAETAPPYGLHQQFLAHGFAAGAIYAEGSVGRDARDDSDVAGTWFGGAKLRARACGGDCSHESFVLPRRFATRGCTHEDGRYFDCCKTAFKPYDLAVQCALIVAKHHLGPAILVTSDGRSQHWDEARAICERVLGYGSTFRLDDDEVTS